MHAYVASRQFLKPQIFKTMNGNVEPENRQNILKGAMKFMETYIFYQAYLRRFGHDMKQR